MASSVPACGAIPADLMAGARKAMVGLLEQAMEAGRVLPSYLQSRHAQSQQLSLDYRPDSSHVECPSGPQDHPAVPGGSNPTTLLTPMPTSTSTNMQGMRQLGNPTLVPGSMHEMGMAEGEVAAAFDISTTILRNLTARLSPSARLLYGVVLTEPQEVFEAFKQ